MALSNTSIYKFTTEARGETCSTVPLAWNHFARARVDVVVANGAIQEVSEQRQDPGDQVEIVECGGRVADAGAA